MKYIDIRSFTDERGTVNVLECGKDVPFDIKRVFWFTNCTEDRGGNHPSVGDYLIVPQRGFAWVVIDDGKHFVVDREYGALFVPEGHKVKVSTSGMGAIIMVLSSAPYE